MPNNLLLAAIAISVVSTFAFATTIGALLS
jgi:hypothetical protein